MEQPEIGPGPIVPTWTMGDRLRKSLEVAGIGVAEMAELLGYNRESIGRWIHDRGVPRKATLEAWCRHTNVDDVWILTGVARSEGFEPPTFWTEDAPVLTLIRCVRQPLTAYRAAVPARSRHLEAVPA